MKGNVMFNNKYFCYVFNNSFESKFKEPSWNRTNGVEHQLCSLLDDARDAPITITQIRSLTGWAKQDIKRWFAILLSAGVFVDDPDAHVNRWRLVRNYRTDRASLVDLIPPIGSTLVSGRQAGSQPASMPKTSIPIDAVEVNVNQEIRLPGSDIDIGDDFYSVFSRI